MHQSTADLIKALDKEEAKRQAAIAALVSMGRPVVPQLLDILELQYWQWNDRSVTGVAEVLGGLGPDAEDALPVLQRVQNMKTLYPEAICSACRDAARRIAAAIPAETPSLGNATASQAIKAGFREAQSHSLGGQRTTAPGGEVTTFRINNYHHAIEKLLLATVGFCVAGGGLVYLVFWDPEGWRHTDGELLSGAVGRSIACLFCIGLALGMVWLGSSSVLCATFGEEMTFRRPRRVSRYALDRILLARFTYLSSVGQSKVGINSVLR